MKAFLKTLLTWLITTIAGSLLLALLFSTDKSGWFQSPLSETFVLFFCISGALSIPGMILYHFFALYLYRIRYAATAGNKLYLSLFATAVTLATAIVASSFLFPSSNEIILIFIIIPYIPPFIFSVWLFNYSKNVKPQQPQDEISGPVLQDVAHRNLIAVPVLAAIPYIQSLVSLFTTYRYSTSFANGMHIFYLAALPAGIFLLWKRKKAGWAITAYFAISALGSLYSFISIVIEHSYYAPSTGITLLINLICNIIIAVILFKQSTCRYLGIGRTMRILTFLISICIVIISFFIYRGR